MSRGTDRGKYANENLGGPFDGWLGRLHEIIYEADTPGGRLFDVALIIVIALSVVVVMLETVGTVGERYGPSATPPASSASSTSWRSSRPM